MIVENDYETEHLLSNISELICAGNTTGYYPYWLLSFGDYYRSWHLKTTNLEIIARSILLGNKRGVVWEVIAGEKTEINWSIKY